MTAACGGTEPHDGHAFGQGTHCPGWRTGELDAPGRWLYGLTADEWLHLACEGQDSEVANCCGNIEQVQDCLRAIMTLQPEDYRWMRLSIAGQLAEHLGEDGSGGHGLDDKAAFPLLHRVLDGLRAEEAAEHEDAARRKRERAEKGK